MKQDAIPLGPIEQAFRRVMRVVGASVSLVSCRCPAGVLKATTVSTASTLSARLPSMLVTFQRDDAALEAILERGLLCLNLLAREHAGLVDPAFSTRDPAAPSLPGGWDNGYRGIPFLSSALANVFCGVSARFDHRGHVIVVSEVLHIHCDPAEERMPLIWLHGMPLEGDDCAHEAG